MADQYKTFQEQKVIPGHAGQGSMLNCPEIYESQRLFTELISERHMII